MISNDIFIDLCIPQMLTENLYQQCMVINIETRSGPLEESEF